MIVKRRRRFPLTLDNFIHSQIRNLSPFRRCWSDCLPCLTRAAGSPELAAAPSGSPIGRNAGVCTRQRKASDAHERCAATHLGVDEYFGRLRDRCSEVKGSGEDPGETRKNSKIIFQGETGPHNPDKQMHRYSGNYALDVPPNAPVEIARQAGARFGAGAERDYFASHGSQPRAQTQAGRRHL